LWQAAHTRTDFAAIESILRSFRSSFRGLPTRRELAGTALGIGFATEMLTMLSVLFFFALE
jgi:hypothetical protein